MTFIDYIDVIYHCETFILGGLPVPSPIFFPRVGGDKSGFRGVLLDCFDSKIYFKVFSSIEYIRIEFDKSSC